ncbi:MULTISPECIES: hypothetical protein [unclassified Leisingera]|uniref:hypothetical protein n=1 Tax=unclassified Leisingera TaxID=2614906 RepID=UPI00126A4063|nr:MULTISPECIES: hypothetical protein [unclassified Leisingera]
MRVIFALCLLLLAAPLSAGQQERICKGKFNFQLPDGTVGCMLGFGKASITKTRSIQDYNRVVSRREIKSVGVELVMFGEPAVLRSAWNRRYKAACKAIMPVISETHKKGSYRNVIINVRWPDLMEVTSDPKGDVRILRSAYMNPSCRSVRYFRGW